jgi:4-amino-4-deoxy-L-arabinose transferase-like glycosyltransferase
MIPLKLKSFWPLLIIIPIYLFSRFYNLDSLPVFGDEAIYIRWSQLIRNVETLRFVPVTDGKQPFFMWLVAASFKLAQDPLISGRFISILAGCGTLITLYIFSLIFFSQRVAFFSSVIYLLLPFTFFFDRLALPDNLLSFFGTTSLLLSVLLAKYPRLDLSLILGFSLGLAWLTKSPAIYFVVLSNLTFIIFNKNNYKKIYFPIISAILGFVIYNILRLGPQFHQIALRNKDYIWSFSEIARHPLDPLLPHISDIFSIYDNYISLPLISVALAGLFLILKKKSKNWQLYIILFSWWFLPLLMNAAVAKIFTARYILFTLPSLIILLSLGLAHVKAKIFYFLIPLCFLPNIFLINQMSSSPQKLKLSSTEVGYVSQWTSGWGIKEVSQYLIQRSKVANIIVGTEGYFGTLPDGLQIYTDSQPQLTVFGVGVDITTIPEKLINARNHGDEVYILFNQSRLKLTSEEYKKLSLVQSHSKPDSDQLVLYRLN